VSASGLNFVTAAEPPRNAGKVTGDTSPAAGGRGKVLQVRGEIKEYKDPKTGARVRRLTGDGSSNVHPYFTSWAFIGNNADNTILVSNRSGAYQWYLLDIPAGRLVQLTAGQKTSPNMACVAKSGWLFYFDGLALHSVKIDTLEDRELYRVPAGFRPALPTCTADGRYVAFAYCQETVLSTETGRIYATMHERYYQHPHSVVMRIDTQKGDAVAAWGEPTWISHVLIHPTQPNLIVFCHEGGGTCVDQRMWIVNLDNMQMRKAAPLYPQRPGESCVHEYFTQQGDVGFQYSLDRPRAARGVHAFYPPDGTWICQYLFPAMRPGTFSRTQTTAWWSVIGPSSVATTRRRQVHEPDDPRQRASRFGVWLGTAPDSPRPATAIPASAPTTAGDLQPDARSPTTSTWLMQSLE
jgi:oligogalacturonide lyase